MALFMESAIFPINLDITAEPAMSTAGMDLRANRYTDAGLGADADVKSGNVYGYGSVPTNVLLTRNITSPPPVSL